MEQKKIDRINELARKAKTPEGLTPAETEERAALRQEYLNSVMDNLRRELDNTWVVDEQGNKRKLAPGKTCHRGQCWRRFSDFLARGRGRAPPLRMV